MKLKKLETKFRILEENYDKKRRKKDNYNTLKNEFKESFKRKMRKMFKSLKSELSRLQSCF